MGQIRCGFSVGANVAVDLSVNIFHDKSAAKSALTGADFILLTQCSKHTADPTPVAVTLGSF